MMASIFFMFCLPSRSTFEGIALFAVHAQIEPFDFIFPAYAYSDCGVDNLQNNNGADDRERKRDKHTDRLIHDLHRVSVHQSERKQLARCILERIVNGVSRKDTSE